MWMGPEETAAAKVPVASHAAIRDTIDLARMRNYERDFNWKALSASLRAFYVAVRGWPLPARLFG